MVLMLGEAEDLRWLAGTLRQFARAGGRVQVDELPFCAARTRITLMEAADRLGVEPADGSGGAYLWRLDGPQAAAFADRVEDLAAPSRLAGSEVLACGTGEGIPVKVSRGEYTDDFLAETTKASRP